jgi:hypothetical protein
MFIHQYDSQNVRKTVQIVTELSAKYNDCNTNLLLLIENSSERGENTIKNSTVQYRIPYRTVQYNKEQYSTIQNSTVQ